MYKLVLLYTLCLNPHLHISHFEYWLYYQFLSPSESFPIVHRPFFYYYSLLFVVPRSPLKGTAQGLFGLGSLCKYTIKYSCALRMCSRLLIYMQHDILPSQVSGSAIQSNDLNAGSLNGTIRMPLWRLENKFFSPQKPNSFVHWTERQIMLNP